MPRIHLLLLVLLLPGASPGLDIENAKRINRSCALCHGVYGQGTPGTQSPRLAGMPKDYLAKELAYYRDGTRRHDPMVVASSVKNLTDGDIDDIAEYLSGIDLERSHLPKIPPYRYGDPQQGRQLYLSECKGCHRDTGLGKPDKGIPQLAGQYGGYLFSQLKKFQKRHRFHDDDPDDETFADWQDTELDHLVAYITQFPPNGPRAGADMAGMEALASMQGMAERIAAATGAAEPIASPVDIAGRFRITPGGEILLNPINQDLRALAGVSGDFRITPGGIEFLPR